MAGEVTLTSYDAFNTRREIMEGMMENAIEWRESIREIRGQAKRNVEAFIGDARNDIEKLRREALNSLRDVKDDVEKEFEEWKKY